MARTRVNSLRIYVMVDDPTKGRSLMEVLGTVHISREFDFDGNQTSAEVDLRGSIVRQVVWDGRSPMPEEQPAIEEPRRELTAIDWRDPHTHLEQCGRSRRDSFCDNHQCQCLCHGGIELAI